MSDTRQAKQTTKTQEQKRPGPAPTEARSIGPDAGLAGALDTPQGLQALPRHPTAAAIRQAAVQRFQQSHGNRALQNTVESHGGAVENLGQRIHSLAGQGAPLEDGLRADLESHLNADLSGVRLHDDSEADRLSRRLSARAFTSGTDIYFRKGAFDTASEDGRRLIAHETAHTVQQSRGPVSGDPTIGQISLSHPQDAFEQAAQESARRFISGADRTLTQKEADRIHSPLRSPVIQRQPDGGGGAGGSGNDGGGGGSGGAGPSSAVASSSLDFKGQTLTKDPTALYEVLNAVATKDGIAGAEAFTSDFANKADTDAQIIKRAPGEGGARGASSYSVSEGDALAEAQIKPVLQQQFSNLKKESDSLITTFKSTTEAAVAEMLNQSKTKLEAEKERYGANQTSSATGNQGAEGAEGSGGGPGYGVDNMNGLDVAAQKLSPLRREMDDLNAERDTLVERVVSNNAGPMPVYTIKNQPRYDEITSLLGEKGAKYEEERLKLEQEFPVLAAFSGQGKADQLEQIAKGKGGDGGAIVSQLIHEQLANIEQVSGALSSGDLDVWTLDTVIQGAKGQMGFTPNTLGFKVIDEYRGNHNWKSTFKDIAIGVIGVALGILAAVPTGGASLGAAATVAGGALSTYTLFNSLKNYQLANAVANTDPDKARVISQEDPSLFWLALDILGSIGDIGAALGAFRTIKTAIRSAEKLDNLEDIKKVVDPACGSAGVPAAAPRITGQLEKNLKLGDEAMEKMRATAKDAYARMSPEDKKRLLDEGIPEEKFVEQMVSNTRRDVLVSGEEGVRRAGLVTDLMQPNNPRIMAIVNGDMKAMDALLIEHGSWQQLMSQLGSGTPEMKMASVKLLERRQMVVEEVDMLYRAKLAGKPSTEATSDVDLSTSGQWDAGAAMIEAEKYVRDKFGPGWSEALRMNFYTMADRLSLYAKEMPNLSPAERALVLKEFSSQTDKFTIAKMMEQAGTDPASLKRVEEYAKTLGVNTTDPEIQKMYHMAIDPAARKGERDRLLQRADELMKKYDSLPPDATPQQRMELAKEITDNQMRANFYTEEAYLGPGAGRFVVEGINVVSYEAKMAVTSQLAMVAHEISKYGGDIAEAMRQYEIYKYINRFAEAAQTAGSKNPRLEYFKNLSNTIYKRERGGMSDVADVGTSKAPGIGEIDKVTEQHLTSTYNDFNAFSHEILKEMDVLAGSAPDAWTRFNTPSPAAGVKPKP